MSFLWYASGTCFSMSFINNLRPRIVANKKKLTRKIHFISHRVIAQVPLVSDSVYKQYRCRDNGEKRVPVFPSDVITLLAV